MHPGAIKKKRSMLGFFKDLLGAVKSTSQKEILRKAMELNAGIETEARNPDKLLDDKNKDLRLYDKMMLDDRIKMIIDLKKKLILSYGGNFVAASEDPKDIEIRDWIEETFYSMAETGGAKMPVRFWDILDNLLDAMVYGFRCAELVWRLVDGKMIVKNIKFMHPIFFDFDYDEFANLNRVYVGRDVGMDTVVEGDEIQRKLLLFVYPYLKDGNWYGDSDLREIYMQYYSKYHLQRFRNIYLQNYGQPIPVVKFDKAKVKNEELETMKDMLKNFQENMYLLIPAVRDPKNGELHGKFEIDFRDGGTAKGTDQFEKAISQIDKQISRKLMIPDKMGFSETDTGSYNLGEIQFDQLKQIVKDMHGRLSDTINGLIKMMTDLNFEGVENYTEFQFESPDDRMTVETVKALTEIGVINPAEKWIRSHVGAPEITEEEQEALDEAAAEKAALAPSTEPSGGFPPKKDDKKADDEEDDDQKKMKNLPRGYPVDFRKLAQTLDQATSEFERDYNDIRKEQSANLVGQVQKKQIVENDDLKAMNALRVKKAGLKKALSLFYAKMYMLGKVSALEEIAPRIEDAAKAFKGDDTYKGLLVTKANFQDEDVWLDRNWLKKFLDEYGDLGQLSKADLKYLRKLRDQAFFITGVDEERILKITKSAILEGTKEGLPAKSVITKIESALTADRKQYATTIARTNMSDAFNTGRMNTYQQDNIRPFVEAYHYQAIMDQDTTKFCSSHDDQWIAADDPRVPLINTPNHFNCRSILVAIMVGEDEVKGAPFYQYKTRFKPWGTGVPAAEQKPAKGFGG